MATTRRSAVGAAPRSARVRDLEFDDLRLVDLVDHGPGGPRQPVGAGIQPGSQDHSLLDARLGRIQEELVEELGAHRHVVGHPGHRPGRPVAPSCTSFNSAGSNSPLASRASRSTPDGRDQRFGERVVDQCGYRRGSPSPGRPRPWWRSPRRWMPGPRCRLRSDLVEVIVCPYRMYLAYLRLILSQYNKLPPLYLPDRPLRGNLDACPTRRPENGCSSRGLPSGLGAALARQLAAQNAVVGLIARRRDRLGEVLADCRRISPDSAMWVADLADTRGAGHLALRAWHGLGGIDVLVNNAAIPKRRAVTELEPDDVEAVMAGQLLRPDANDAGLAAADAGPWLGHDRQRVQCRRPARDHPRNRLLCKQIRAVRLERGDGRGPARQRHLGQADRARPGRHRDLGPARQ